MTRAQILRKKTGIILAVVGIILSLMPAVKLADGTKLFVFQIIGNDTFFDMGKANESPISYIVGIILCIVFIYGLLVHVINLILWLRKKKENTYIGVMALNYASFLALLGSMALVSFEASGTVVALFPYTIWQCLRIIVTLGEVVIKLHGEELFNVFFLSSKK